MKKFLQRLTKRIKVDAERGSRTGLVEELFQDFNRNKAQVYQLNFFRGIFFGVGSVLGATIVVGLLVWLLNMFTDLPGGIGGFVQSIVDAMNRSRP